MKIIYLSFQDENGGAFIGAKRLNHALIKQGVECSMLVRKKVSNDPHVIQYSENIKEFQKRFNRLIVAKMGEWRKNLKGTNSFNLRHTGVHKIINNSDADCVIMHWIGNDTISIREIALIDKPIIWRLADMWAFSGCTHYSDDKELDALENPSSPVQGSIDKFVWSRKKKSWQDLQIKIVCGSEWLSSKVRSSSILGNYEAFTIPSSLNTDIFAPSRSANNKNSHECNLLFGANNALKDPRKGFDLLIEAIVILKKNKPDLRIKLKVFGHSKQEKLNIRGIEVNSVGYIKEEVVMSKLYQETDIFMIPSRADNLPFTAMESLSCGTPVVGFAIGGIPEIVDHQVNGFLASPFNCNKLAEGIEWIINRRKSSNLLQTNAREKATRLYSYQSQAKSYINLIDSITS